MDEFQEQEEKAQEVENGRPPVWRMKFIVLPLFQYKVIFQAVGISLCVIFFTYLIEKYLIIDLIDSHIVLETDSAKFMNHINELRRRLDYMFYVKASILFTAVFTWGLMTSHRVAGPIFRIQKSLKGFRDGDNTQLPLKFREKDNFHELAECINQAVDKAKK